MNVETLLRQPRVEVQGVKQEGRLVVCGCGLGVTGLRLPDLLPG